MGYSTGKVLLWPRVCEITPARVHVFYTFSYSHPSCRIHTPRARIHTPRASSILSMACFHPCYPCYPCYPCRLCRHLPPLPPPAAPAATCRPCRPCSSLYLGAGPYPRFRTTGASLVNTLSPIAAWAACNALKGRRLPSLASWSARLVSPSRSCGPRA